MADDADRADKRITDTVADGITDTVADGIQAARRALSNRLTACGICHWCESPVGTGRVFCSTECCEDYRHEQERRKAMGL